jgi:hypothetical protein
MVRLRIKLKPERKRLRLEKVVLSATYNTRSRIYYNMRFYWLHELRQLRAKRRIAGANVKKDMKAAQGQLAKLREEYCK